MRKSIILFLVMLSIVSFSSPVMASEKDPKPNSTATTNKVEEIPAEVQVMLDRLEEIKAMDKSDLKSAERKELRAEVREIKSTLRAAGNGLYISTGVIIIILLLIIIL
ncbi:hypothetical protein [Confluentibacter flavum]|uniref:Seryl-tRNA synthetase n=1 Tax=Confluentibacter flavum TaxID=1909700 RepID=A0A2N3HI00_9FLAO|nr:hypothetical protein [Confluentibacter flavum]PKQ44589.1 hypothetical protein CSW08_12435 [Confluentibacter flavum]